MAINFVYYNNNSKNKNIMSIVTISLIIALIIYVVYNSITIGIFGLPPSLSETYYLYKNKWNIGFVFPIMMYLVVGLMMPAWLTLSEVSMFQFLSFLAPASLLFVGTAPAFKSSSLENSVHTISAYIAALCSLLWVCLVTPYWWTIIISFVVFLILAILTKTVKSSKIYWLESVAFASTFISAILFSLL